MMYMGKVDGKYYVASTVGSLMDPDDSTKKLRARDVMLNTLDVKRANGNTWLQDIYQASLMAESDDYALPQPLWYHDAVAYCLKNGLLSPKADGFFGLSDTVSRAEVADALWRMAGKPETEAAASFTDVSADSDAAAAIGWAADSGVMVGYSADRFGADDPLTREQVVTVLYRYAEQQKVTLEPGDGKALQSFRDQSRVSPYARDAMQWACASGILRGTDGRLDPQGTLNRVQLAAILEQFGNAIIVEPAEEPEPQAE